MRRPDLKMDDSERRLRHRILMQAFERLDAPGDPWMNVLSQNDADTVIYITSRPKETFTVYCWKDHETWTSLSATRIAGMIRSHYAEIYYEDVRNVVPQNSGESIEVNGTVFWTPAPVSTKMAELVGLVLDHVALVKK